MKHLKIITLIVVLSLTSSNLFGASWFQRWVSKWKQWHAEHHHHSYQSPSNGDPVGAPLDGGLLVLLGAAGVTYYGVRKKKRAGVDPK